MIPRDLRDGCTWARCRCHAVENLEVLCLSRGGLVGRWSLPGGNVKLSLRGAEVMASSAKIRQYRHAQDETNLEPVNASKINQRTCKLITANSILSWTRR